MPNRTVPRKRLDPDQPPRSCTRMRQIHNPYDFDALHALLVDSFAYMDGRIDPPSSLHYMRPETLAHESRTKEIWVIEQDAKPVACMILTPQAGTLYLGKLTVSARCRGQGFARRLIQQASTRARQLGLPSITLQTRIELTENHAIFLALGFHKAGFTSHDGFDKPTSITFVRPL